MIDPKKIEEWKALAESGVPPCWHCGADQTATEATYKAQASLSAAVIAFLAEREERERYNAYMERWLVLHQAAREEVELLQASLHPEQEMGDPLERSAAVDNAYEAVDAHARSGTGLEYSAEREEMLALLREALVHLRRDGGFLSPAGFPVDAETDASLRAACADEYIARLAAFLGRFT